MKKYLFLIALIAVAFLWWGNRASAAATCQDYDNEYITSTDWTCPDWVSDGADDSGNMCCNPNPIWWTWAFCVDVPTSKLNNDPHALVTVMGFSCKCMPGYGESSTKSTPNICQPCSDSDVCCGVKLNTNVPFVGDCIENKDENPNSNVTEENAFPVLMSSLTKMLVTIILIVSFVLIVVWGIMIASAWANQSNASAGKKLIMKVVIGIALLGASGVILRLINPNFFG